MHSEKGLNFGMKLHCLTKLCTFHIALKTQLKKCTGVFRSLLGLSIYSTSKRSALLSSLLPSLSKFWSLQQQLILFSYWEVWLQAKAHLWVGLTHLNVWLVTKKSYITLSISSICTLFINNVMSPKVIGTISFSLRIFSIHDFWKNQNTESL